MIVIHKTSDDCRVPPNFTNYERTRTDFDWAAVPDLCAGMAAGGCNIAYAAVDRHADGPDSSRTALRFISAGGWDGAVSSRDLSYAELGRLSRSSPVCCAHWGSARATESSRSWAASRSCTSPSWAGSATAVWCRRCSRPSDQNRSPPGSTSVRPTCWSPPLPIYRRKIAKIRDRLGTVRYILIVGRRATHRDVPGTLNFWRVDGRRRRDRTHRAHDRRRPGSAALHQWHHRHPEGCDPRPRRGQ